MNQGSGKQNINTFVKGFLSMENQTEKRTVKTTESKGLSLKEIILVAVLLAAGAVLKFFVAPLFTVGNMKPNFIIAMYCLSIMVIKPRFREAAIIGLLAGITCQFAPGAPYLNIGSELVGAIAMYFLIKLPLRVKKVDFTPAVATFITTYCSGLTYLALLAAFFGLGDKTVALFVLQMLGTSTINAIIVTVLNEPLKLAFKK